MYDAKQEAEGPLTKFKSKIEFQNKTNLYVITVIIEDEQAQDSKNK